jgi:predicted acylesterase/phospholipase RssA
MNAGIADNGQPSETYCLTGSQLQVFLDLARPRTFKAGEWIAAPGRPLLGWYLIESGAVATADDTVADLARRGLILERNDMFGEYSLVEEADPFPSVMRALTDVVTLFLRAEIYPSLKQRVVGLDDRVRARVTLNKYLASFVAALKRYRPLKDVPPYQLIKIAQRGEVSEYKNTQTEPLKVNQSDKGIVFVASGELKVDNTVVLQEGSIYSPVANHTRWVTKGTCLIALDWAAVRDSVPNYVRLSMAMGETSNPKGPEKPVMVRLASDAQDTPLSALCVLLAETLQLDQPRAKDATGTVDPFKAVVLRLYPDEASFNAGRAHDEGLRERLRTLGSGVISWVLSPGPQHWPAGSVPHVALIDETPCRGSPAMNGLNAVLKPSKLLYFVRDSWEVSKELKSPTMSTIRCVFLRGGKVSEFPSFNEPGSLFVAAYHPGTVRLRFDDLASIEGKSYKELSERDQRSLSRCGRALMERRVGLALGGGGAWGYAHIALLEALEEVQLPIDIISGVSFGSLAGGFYAAGGMPLLYELVQRGVKLQLALLASSMVPPLIHQYLTALLEDRKLQFLETPFFPVGLNLATGEEWSPAIGPVSHGIRASSMLPGMFSPMITDGVRSVDGVFVNNVPEGVLTRECADFIIASDVMQTPGDPFAQPPRWVSSTLQQAWRTIKSVSPVSRMKDSMEATAFLTKIADERDKGLANQRFTPGRTGLPQWDFSKGNQIIEVARERAQKFAREAYAAWIDLPTPRMSS